MKTPILFLVAAMPFLMACKLGEGHSHHVHQAAMKRPVALKQVTLKFSAQVGAENFVCGKSYDGIGVTRSRITPSDFRFYVSAVELIDRQGKAVPVKLDQDDLWQYRNVALLDFEDGSGPCRNGNPGLHQQVTGSVPAGDYRGVRFTLGVPFELNHGDPTIAPAPLNLTSMFWVWQAGYKFAKIDMATSGLPQAADAPSEMSIKDKLAAMEKFAAASGVSGKRPPRAAGFSIHLGSTDCASASLTTPPTGCKNPNRLTVTFDNFDPDKNTVVADAAASLSDTNVDINAPGTAPGCMSGPDDTDCAQVIPAFGLSFGGKPAAQQRFFSVR